MIETIEIETGNEAIPFVRFSADMSMLLKSVYTDDLVLLHELNQRKWRGWVGEATDSEIQYEFDQRDLKDTDKIIREYYTSDLRNELESRGMRVIGDEDHSTPEIDDLIARMIVCYNDGIVVHEDVRTLLETLSERLVCTKKQLQLK